MLSDRVQHLGLQVQDRQQRGRRYESALKRARYHAKRLLNCDAGDRPHDWQVLIGTIDEMVKNGTPPSSVDLRELLVNLVDQVPDVPLPENVQFVMREVDRFLATRPVVEAEEEGMEATEEVKRVAKWLAGKVLVLIGGVPRPHAREALRRAVGVKEVDWVETREHESFAPLETHVARPDVAVVLLAIRWTSHAYGNVEQFCAQHDKPLVRLPAGYNPNQVAVQIIQQCSGRF